MIPGPGGVLTPTLASWGINLLSLIFVDCSQAPCWIQPHSSTRTSLDCSGCLPIPGNFQHSNVLSDRDSFKLMIQKISHERPGIPRMQACRIPCGTSATRPNLSYHYAICMICKGFTLVISVMLVIYMHFPLCWWYYDDNSSVTFQDSFSRVMAPAT